ncbi:SRPBCC domain-containing protein [Propionimicrobium sp. PCR01-08-3]|uniref:SRPBCC domain-containing protein n=1 Tax=Propionimicrobium sp. PCR01-08-3 TaxID=3052086 RepID=UPI00255C65A0|nr:SRPBCC domain-containing protein [Propionimicrobium sp. PCR01-08-3]WIY82025.1 SRPBCC domain-containing protein [Propionimicrobium sp. PCR01-08-3]WIY83413.1 SRPBCC domain-containing protein [Propionimicrobium sp. PCR01-08-3]
MTNTDAGAPATAPQIYRIFIKASADAIWDAIVTPEFTAKYFYGSHVETSGEVGTPFRYRSPDGTSLWGDETVLESEPPHRLVVGWRSLFSPDAVDEPASRVTWQIDDQANGTCMVTVIHDQLDESPHTAAGVFGAGWMLVLSGLKTLLETGESLAERR